MTHPNLQTNGASLEDCHTNFFALMDLCGIKWRRLSAENLFCVDPLDDPVLMAFTKCLAADILCVWRRVPHPRGHADQSRLLDLNPQHLLFKKELWIFWYGNEPDLNNILCTELSEVEQGSWENGLSYECRTLLFKAIHNRIERSLLARDYVRLGKWFVQPYDGMDKPTKSPHSISFLFFIHGESTVCACVDVREPPPVYRLTQQHILNAQGTQPGLQVILGPYGQAGILTGQAFKDGDHAIQKLLEEWRQFYPLDVKLGRDGGTDGCQLPTFVEVIVGGVKLKYPSCYVLVPNTEDPAGHSAVQPSTLLVVPGGHSGLKGCGPAVGQCAPAVSSVSLTPPTSPCDPVASCSAAPKGLTVGASGASFASSHHARHVHNLSSFSCAATTDAGIQTRRKFSRRVISDVAQDSTVLSAAAKITLQSPQADEGSSGNWEFVDPAQKSTCACSKCKKSKSGQGSSGGGKAGAGGGTTGSSGGGPSVGAGGKKGDKSEKGDKQQQQRHLRNTTPFHRRTPMNEDAVVFDGEAVSRHMQATASSLQFKAASCPGTALGSSLPQLRTGALDPPTSVGSPASVAPSPLVAPSSHSQPASVSQPDLAMPTLSPHPLASKDHDASSNAEDQPMVESQDSSLTVAAPGSVSQAPTPQDLREGPKSAAEQPQAFSPFCAGSAPPGSVEPPKGAEPGSWPQGGQTPAQVQQSSSVVGGVTQVTKSAGGGSCVAMEVAAVAQNPPLKRPALPPCGYEGLEDDDPAMESLYDYSSLNAWLQLPVKKFKSGVKLEPCRRGSRGSTGGCDVAGLLSPCSGGAVFIKREPLTPQMMSVDGDGGGGASPKPTDPYEFVDDFPTTVSMAGFKIKNEATKEDDKVPREPGQPQQPCAANTSATTAVTAAAGPTPADATGPGTPTATSGGPGAAGGPPPAAAPFKENKTSVTLDFIGSPQTPKTQGAPVALLQERDLVATFKDLDQLFDTDDDTSDDPTDNAFQTPSSPASMKVIGILGDDGTPGKMCKTTGTIGIGSTELSRMFPTPPSLEQASPCGLIGMGDSTTLEGGEQMFTSSREHTDPYTCYGGQADEFNTDWSYVFKPVPMAKFMGSSKYAPLLNLPSQTLPPISLPAHCVYKPSWQYPLSITDKPQPSGHSSAQTSVEAALDRMHGSVGRSAAPSPATFVSSVEPRMPPSFELQSPASNASSYLNKNLNSMDDGGGCGGLGAGGTLPMPEVHSLLVNLALSDSLLNVFKDHNFDSCTICVCNINIKGSDVGVYLPDFGNPMEEQSGKCTCGFSAVVNRRYGHQAGLFYEDEVEITGLRNLMLDRRKPSLLALDHGKEAKLSAAVASGNSSLKDTLDPLPSHLMELLKAQYTTMASFSCNLFYKTMVAYHHQQGAVEQEAMQSYVPFQPPSSLPTGGGGGGGGGPTTATAASIMATICAVASGCSPSSSNSSAPLWIPVWPRLSLLPSALCPRTQGEAISMIDNCEVTFAALEQGRQTYDGSLCLKLDENLKQTVVHKWPFLTAKLPANNQDLVRLLRALKPLLQEAIHKKQSTQFWEATTTTTFPVSGPLTWREFLQSAGRTTEDQWEPQPIPSLLVGYDKDWLALSPFSIKYWEKLLLEPYSLPRDVAYIVVSPESDYILGNVKKFFKELSGAYEMCRLGRHSPITKVLRDGILRVGKKAAKNLAKEPVDEWFNLIGDSLIASKLKLYAQVCQHYLASQLNLQQWDASLLDSPTSMKPPEKVVPAASPMPPPTPENQDKDRVPTPKPLEPCDGSEGSSHSQGSTKDGCAGGGGGGGGGPGCPGGGQDGGESDDESQAPSIVIYLVDPFSYCSDNPETIRLSTLGLLRCYSQMLQLLPEHVQSNINLQIIPLESILEQTTEEDRCKQTDRLKSLAFSVFAQCRRTLAHQSSVKSLTGFGPAAAAEIFMKRKDAKNVAPHRMYNPPFILAPMKDKQTQLTESFGDHTEKATVLYCAYCLSEDQRWLLATCTDDRGEILDTCVINVDIPNRHRRRKASARKIGLQKLMDWLLGIMSSAVMPWRLVVGRLGRLGHGELQGWSNLLSRRTLVRFSKHLKDMCKQCHYLSVQDTPCILSACLVSLEADSAFRVMPDQFTPDDVFGSSCNSCDLSTPQDASCTHIHVFPTSATTQSTPATYPVDALCPNIQDVDILTALEDEEGHSMMDINAIFNWSEVVESPVDSSLQESNSGSPDLGINSDKPSSFPHPGFSNDVDDLTDPQEEAPQLLQQPLALGYYVSTAKTGPLPKWFWTPCTHLENVCPAFLKSALHLHSAAVQQSSDDFFQQQSHLHNYHPLDSNLTTDVLRYVLEGYNALSWLSVDPATHDRRSCLPVHIQVLMQMYYAMAALV